MKYIKAFTRIFKYMYADKWMYFLSVVLNGLTFIMLFATPFVNRMLVEMITGYDTQVLRNIILIMIGLILLAPLVAYGQYRNGLAVDKLANNLRKALFAHIQRLPLATLGKWQTGDYIARISNDALVSAQVFHGMTVLYFMRFVIVTTVAMTLLIITEWRIAVLSVVYNIICFWISIKLNPLVNRLEREARSQMALGANTVLETIRALPIVSIFAMATALGDRYMAKLNNTYKSRAKMRTVTGGVYGIVDFFSFSAQAVGFVFSILLLYRGDLGLADAVYLASLMGLTSGAMLSLSTFLLFIQRPMVASTRVFEILDEDIKLETEAAPGRAAAKGDAPALVLSNITFAYLSKDENIFSNFNLTINKGEHIALVGPSGGGKTTLVQLIAALYTPQSGSISYFGTPNDELTLSQIRQLISYVPQEPILFEGSVMYNILQGRPTSTTKEVEAAALKAGLTDVSLETEVGERGTNLSGGQRQRVAIARAILKDAPIFILDEATSALDSETEDCIKLALENLGEEYTRITIAHRPSTIEDADRVVKINA